MKTIVLYGHGHQQRGVDLANAYATECVEAKHDSKKIPGLTRLTFWGHGIPIEFCEMTPEVFVATLAAWKKNNSSLDSVEILTCNGRYTANGENSFTDNVRNIILKHRFKYRSLQKLKLRGLPNETTPSGKICHYSILSSDPTSKSWAYVATPGYFEGSGSQHESHMFGSKYFLDSFLTTPTGRQSYVQAYSKLKSMRSLELQNGYAVFKNMDQKKVDDFNTKLKTFKEDAFVMVGNSVGSLAWYLKEVK